MNTLLKMSYDFSGEVSPERFTLAAERIMKMIRGNSLRSTASAEKYEAFFTLHFVNEYDIKTCAKVLGMSTKSCYAYRSMIIKCAQHPSVRGILFNDDYFSEHRMFARAEKIEYNFLLSSLSPRAKNFVRRLAFEADESIDALVEIPPSKLISLRGYGAKSVKELMLHIGERYIPRWWPELAGADVESIDVYELCLNYKEA